jgi:phosphoesterase RecJ-like protein
VTQNNSIEIIRDLISNAQTIMVTSHIRPDGDAIGSLLGLGLSLLEAGKQVSMVLVDGFPSAFRYLPGSNQILRSMPRNIEFDLTISLDASDPERLGNAFGERGVDLNIDHHITNVNFGKINFVDPSAVATCAILAEHLPEWGLKINNDTASALLSGIITDTIGFRTSNMNTKAMRITADLMDYGANLPQIYTEALVNRSFEQILYWSYALQKMQRRDGIIWTTLSLADRQLAGYNGNDDADLNNLLSSISEADISVLFVEQNNSHVKVSWRAKPGINVSSLAFSFGGGGHPAASGVDLQGALTDVQNTVMEATFAHLKQTKDEQIS